MAVSVSPVEKKKDQLEGMVMSLGSSFLQSKMGGAAGGAASKAKDAASSASGQSGTGLGELLNAGGGSANQTSVSSPRDRRMMRGY